MKIQDVVVSDRNFGNECGIESTGSFLINARPFSIFYFHGHLKDFPVTLSFVCNF